MCTNALELFLARRAYQWMRLRGTVISLFAMGEIVCASHECFFLKLILSQLVSLKPYSSLLNSILWQNRRTESPLLLQLFLQHIMFVICVIYSLWCSSKFFSTLSRLVWNFEIQQLQTCCHDLNFTEANIWDKTICIKLHLYCILRLVYMGFSRYMRNFLFSSIFLYWILHDCQKSIKVIGIHTSVQHQLRIIH